jgi:MFS family permease
MDGVAVGRVDEATRTPARERVLLGAVLLIFFTSGFAALVYQVIWQRVLALFSGTDVYSVTVIVSALMGGLGCGILAGGHLADKLGAGRHLIAFAVTELLVALFAMGVSGSTTTSCTVASAERHCLETVWRSSFF